MKPWSKVAHIEIRPTKSDGAYWVLRLECGHTAFRHAWSGNKFDEGVKILMRGMVARNRGLQGAPHKVRCNVCPEVK